MPTGSSRHMEELVRRTVGPSIEIETVLAAGLWPCFCDPNQLENAILNLCINARDAMPDGGRRHDRNREHLGRPRRGHRTGHAPGQYVAICVTDTGTGMPPEVAARAFDPFFTTKPAGKGTGLGLSMIHGFAKQSDGQVRIYSEVGQGTTVRIYLPRHHGKALESPRWRTGTNSPEPRRARRCSWSMTSPGCGCWSGIRWRTRLSGHRGGRRGLGPEGAAVRREDRPPDNGLRAAGRHEWRQMADAARVRRPDLNVLFITGYAENAAISNGRLEPGMHVLSKPFPMEMLAARIRSIIEGS